MNNQATQSLHDLNTIKKFCNTHLFDIATGAFRLMKTNKIRYIDPEGKFGVTSIGRFFFIDDCMYIITKNAEYKEFHNSCIVEFSEELDILKYTEEYIVRVLFAGIFTGHKDNKGNRIFTGDIVKANILVNRQVQSNGGSSRTANLEEKQLGSKVTAGVSNIYGQYVMMLDNHFAPLSWATKIEIVGNLFGSLNPCDTEVDIHSLCNSFSQKRRFV